MAGSVERPVAEGCSAVVGDIRPIWRPGPEDIVIDHQTGWAYVASQARPPGGPAAIMRLQGAIYGFDLKQERPKAINLTDDLFALEYTSELHSPATQVISGPGDEARLPLAGPQGAFHPGGISLYPSSGEATRLFAINQRSTQHWTIEIFKVKKGSLAHLRTVGDNEHLISPNDLVAVGVDQFYVTNDHAFSSFLLQNIENILHQLPYFQSGSILYFDGAHFTTVADAISFPNGIAVDVDAGRMYVASVLRKQLLVAEWNDADPTKRLVFDPLISLPASPDNLEWDGSGNLLVGSHPDFTALGAYFLGLRSKSPSCVLRVSPEEAKELEEREAVHQAVTTIWRDDGTQLSSSSVAGLYKRADGRNILLIGAFCDDHLLICELKEEHSEAGRRVR